MKQKSKNISFFARMVADDLDITKKHAEEVITLFLDLSADYLSCGNRLHFRNLGSFKLKSYKAHKGHNPATGEEIVIPEKTKVVFKPSTYLREML